MFSKKEDEKDSKLKFGDRLRSAEYKLYRKGGNMEKLERERLNNTKKWKKGVIVGSALGGAAIGAANEISLENATGGLYRGNPAKGALLNGAIAVGGAGLGLAARKVLEKKSPKYKKGWDRQKDLLDYRMGKLSKEEYIKRWGGKLNGKDVEGSKNKKDKN